MQRINWIDYAKSFAIFGVVLLHVHASALATQMINGFIMPLFFILSGFLFSYRRNPVYGEFVYKRFRQLVVPYLWIGALSYVLWVFFLRRYGSDPNDDVVWYVPAVGLLTGMPKALICNIPIWSLLAFFVVETVAYPFFSTRRGVVWVMAASLTLTGVVDYLAPGLMGDFPFVIGPSLAGLFFYGVGFMGRKVYDGRGVAAVSLKRGVAVLVSAALLFGASVMFNGNVDFYVCNYSSFPWFVVSALSGSCIVIVASMLVSKAGGSALVRFISETTLIVCGFHLLVFAFVKGVALLGLGIDPGELTDGFGRGLLFAVGCFLLTLPLCYIIRKYFRPLVDK